MESSAGTAAVPISDRAHFGPRQPLAWGTPAESLLLQLRSSPVFEVIQGDHNERYEVAARFADRGLELALY